MRLQIADGGVWWISKVEEVRAPHGMPLHRVIDEVRSAFRFMSVSDSVPKEGEALLFREGSIETDDQEITIKLMELYTNGVHIVTPGNTDFADIILERTITLFVKMGMRFPDSPPIYFHTSEVIFDLDKSLDSIIAHYSAISSLISKNIPHADAIQCAALAFGSDPKLLTPEMAAVNPTIFRIERRTGEDYDDNRYFSFANTSTEKHLEILQELERLL
jgi:hypothetical protein